MKDWRGNKYNEEKLDGVCEICKKAPAVRNCCTAEGDTNRTHWHGMVHTKTTEDYRSSLKSMCRACADKENGII